MIDVFELFTLYAFRESVVNVFIKNESLKPYALDMISYLIISIACEFLQAVLCGTLNALGKQKPALVVNLITYFVFVLPFSFFFAFRHGERVQTEYETGFWFTYVVHKTKPGLGVPGLWLGVTVGLFYQIVSYAMLVVKADWTGISHLALLRS